MELLPCSLAEIREHLSQEGDLSLQALQVLRSAEEERRGENENENEMQLVLYSIVIHLDKNGTVVCM